MPKRKPKIKLNYLISIFLGILLLVGGYFYTTMQRTSINEIKGGILPPPALPLSPPPNPQVCATVSTLSLTGSCGNNSYQNISFKCGISRTTNNQGGKTSCKPFTTWYQYAQSTCAATCPTPSPTPTPHPSPKPSYPTTSSTPIPTPIACTKLYFFHTEKKVCIQTSDYYDSNQIACTSSKVSCATNLSIKFPGMTSGVCYNSLLSCQKSNGVSPTP